jgi:hypothetical protein
MPREDGQNELQATNRRLRLRIGRLRRRIDGRLHSLQREGRRLASWRTYVRSYPGSAVMAALGAGLALSAGVQRRRLARLLGMRLFRWASSNIGSQFWGELQRVWSDSTPSQCHKKDDDE